VKHARTRRQKRKDDGDANNDKDGKDGEDGGAAELTASTLPCSDLSCRSSGRVASGMAVDNCSARASSAC
jgi:hypothetical protein